MPELVPLSGSFMNSPLLLSLSRLASARWSSSLNSRTFLSWVANAVRKALESCKAFFSGEGGRSGTIGVFGMDECGVRIRL